MEDLSVYLCFREHLRGDPCVLASFPFDQVDDIIYTAVLEAKLLLLISPIDYGGCQVIGCFSLNYEVEHIVNVLPVNRLLFGLFRLNSLFGLLGRLLCFYGFFLFGMERGRLLDSQDPNEISKWECLLFTVEVGIYQLIVDVVALLLILFFTIIHIEDHLTIEVGCEVWVGLKYISRESALLRKCDLVLKRWKRQRNMLVLLIRSNYINR